MCITALGAAMVGQAAAASMTTAQLAILGGSMAASVAGVGISAYSSIQQGRFSEKMAKNNAIVSDRMSKDAIARGQRDEMNQRLKTAQIRGQQRAALGASGRDISGSASDLLADTAMMGELDALTIRSNAEREAYGYDVQASNERAGGKMAKRRGMLQGSATLLAGAAKTTHQWQSYTGR